jgi:neurotransmitter:Na+ symporter, NSS family
MDVKNNKMTWVKESGFIFAMLGSAVGFANILAFSAQCYRNGGGAFLIPFFAAVFMIGIPMLFLEGAIGKKYGLPIASAYGRILPKKWKIFGWIAVLSCLTIGSFYSVLTSWSVAYTYFAATDSIPSDSAHFFQKVFLRDSGSIDTFNGISWTILISTVVVSIFTWIVNSKNIGSGVEKVCSFFLPLLFIIVTLFSIIVAFLPGAWDGFYYYLNPDFSKIMSFQLWRDVFGHVFFSFSLGIGIVVGYSRHTKQETNMKRAMIFVALGDVLISIIAGFAIFGCVGYMSQKTGTPFHEIVKSDSTFEMGFIIFPQILDNFADGIRPLVGAIFFFCVFIAGITGVFSIVESVAGNIEIEFSLPRQKAVTLSVIIMFCLSIFFCMGNGTHILGALTPMVMGYTFLLGGIGQIIAFMFLDKSLAHDAVFLNRHNKTTTMFFIAKYFGLAFLTVSFIGALHEESLGPIGMSHAVRWGWFFLVLLVAIWCSNRRTNE